MVHKSKSKLHSLTLTLLLIALIASGTLMQTRTVYAINTPWLNVSGRYIKDPSGNTVILRGVSLVDVSVADSRTRNARQLIDMATDSSNGWYARVVRLPVYPDAIDGQPGWNAGPDAYFNNHLNPAIQECIARQIYCIIDWHYITDYNTSAVDTATRAFWSYVAPKYANTPNVLFELYNEPVSPNDWNTWKSVAQPWVNLIRNAAPNNLILVGGPNWDQNVASAASNPFTGSNLVYVCHVYPQHGGQSTWDSWFGNSSSTVPYFISEWGWQNGGANPTSGTLSGYGTPFSNYLDSKGVSWTAWVFDDYWQPVMFDTSWNLLGGENYMGQFTKDFLSRHQNDNLPGGGTTSTVTSTQTRTSTRTSTNTSTATGTVVTSTFTRTPTRTATPTFTLTGPSPTFTRTPTRTNTPTFTPTGGLCSPVTASITAPFIQDGSGTFCWQSSNLGSYINSWNLVKLTVNGVDFTNKYASVANLPAKINGYWYVSYTGNFAWSHFEAK
jgi:endoglucanase